jgi:hypothetical protein
MAPLRELSPAMTRLLLLTLLATVAAVTNWITRNRRTGPPVAPTGPMARWRTSAIIAVPLNLIVATQYLFAAEKGGRVHAYH